jgi:hypothetical protein
MRMLRLAMDRQSPRVSDDVIDLYIRTYSSILRSSAEVRVRAFEEAHLFSDSTLHIGAREPVPDVAAFAYSAGRLPECFPETRTLVLGQSFEQFESAGLPVRTWDVVRSRGRRRAMRFGGNGTLAVFITSVSDIDDLVPIVTAYQIEWNKMHTLLRSATLATGDERKAMNLDAASMARVLGALGARWQESLRRMAEQPLDVSMRLLYGSFAQYQTSAQRWWSGIVPRYVEGTRRRPVYFVSSNTHSLINLLGGFASAHQDAIAEHAQRSDPEALGAPLEQAVKDGDTDTARNILYYLVRSYIEEGGMGRLEAVQKYDAESGIVSVTSPGKIDVGAQLIELRRLIPDRLDPRVRVPGLERLRDSQAVILNIDYPLGLAAYHHLSRVAQGVGELRGVYVMGKAATLNARVGDVVLLRVVYDEHSRNTYLLQNCFAASDLQPYMRQGTVLDNQKAVTVRSAFLQNRRYMSAFYEDGYTILEMEAGPYLSAVHEIIHPVRHPDGEIVNLAAGLPFDVGIIHYASDTPYSRRQSLLSKSLSFFGVESTYAAAIAIVRKILSREVEVVGSSRHIAG